MGANRKTSEGRSNVKDFLVIIIGIGLIWWTARIFKSSFNGKKDRGYDDDDDD